MHLLTMLTASVTVSKQGLFVLSCIFSHQFKVQACMASKMVSNDPGSWCHLNPMLYISGSDLDHKKHSITKYQKAHDKIFIEAMCSSFVLDSICPVSKQKEACVNMGKLLTHFCYQEYENADDNEILTLSKGPTFTMSGS